MPLYKVSFFFESLEQAVVGAGASVGWTENWYWDTPSDIDTAINAGALDNYVNRRLICLPNCYRASFVRVSDYQRPRIVKVKGLTGKTGVLLPAQGGQVQCAVLVDFFVPPGLTTGDKSHHRRFLLRA